MDVAREDRIERLFEQALALPAAYRGAFLDDACAGDAALRAELEELVSNAPAAHEFVGRVAGRIVARLANNVLGGSPLVPVTPKHVPVRRRRVKFAGAVAVGVALATTAGFAVSRWSSQSGDRILSLAVLPVNEVTPDSTRHLSADDITTLLIGRLAQVRELREVTPRTSVERYKGTRKSSREIGQELGVDGLVTVSVFRDQERARFTVNLIRADAEQVVWSRRFERRIGEIAELEREVVLAIAEEAQRWAKR